MNAIDKVQKAAAPVRWFGIAGCILGPVLIAVGIGVNTGWGDYLAGFGSVGWGMSMAFLLSTSRKHHAWVLAVANGRPERNRGRGLQPIKCTCKNANPMITDAERAMAEATGLDVTHVHALMDVFEGHAERVVNRQSGRS